MIRPESKDKTRFPKTLPDSITVSRTPDMGPSYAHGLGQGPELGPDSLAGNSRLFLSGGSALQEVATAVPHVSINVVESEPTSRMALMWRTLGFLVGISMGGALGLWLALATAAEIDPKRGLDLPVGQPAQATVEAPPGVGALPDSRTFGESRFGAAPNDSSQGAGRAYLSRRVAEMEEREDTLPPRFMESGKRWDSGQVGGSRSPASVSTALRASSSTPEGLAIQAEINKKGVQEVSLIAGDLGYFPKAIFVTKDVPVRLYVTGASKNSLCIMLDSFQVRKQVRSQRIEEITFMPQAAGTYRFYCPVNGMEGKLVVREVAALRGGGAE